jgi:pimeloyl-ACP methyl ester carboxylesterase
MGWSAPPGTPLLPPVRTGIEAAIDDGLQRYTDIRGPVLAIFAQRDLPPGVGSDKQIHAAMDSARSRNVGVFARIVPQAQILILPNADHFVFNSNKGGGACRDARVHRRSASTVDVERSVFRPQKPAALHLES